MMNNASRIQSFTKSFWVIVTLIISLSAPYVTAQSANKSEIDFALHHTGLYSQFEGQDWVRVIVYLEEELPVSAPVGLRAQSVNQLQANVLSELTDQDFQLIREFTLTPGFAGLVSKNGLNKLLNNPNVVTVYEDQKVYAVLSESVPLINADDVHNLGITGDGVTVAVLDTGIDTDHPDLSDDLLAQYCFTDGACPPSNSNEGTSAEDGEGHGTSVSGIITSKGTVAPLGVAPDAGIVAVKVLDDSGSGWFSDITAGIDWVVANRSAYNIVAINMSLSGGLYSGLCDSTFPDTRDAVNSAVANGISVFAASGNDGSSTQMGSPACLSNAISVGAVYDNSFGGLNWGVCIDYTTGVDQINCYSNSNGYLDLLAPSYHNTTTRLGGGTTSYPDYFAGTSAASPHAAAVAALMLDADSGLDPETVELQLENTGKPIYDSRNGLTFPRIDALAAIQTTPGSFSKTSPANAATNQTTSPTLTWGASSGATGYQYCYDTTNDNACSGWTSNGSSTSKALSGLSQNTTYYWHVRATNSFGTTYSNGSATAFWSFTTGAELLKTYLPIIMGQ